MLFGPETARRTRIGASLSAWAAWLLADPDVNGTYAYATRWQDRFGALDHDQRLIPLRFFTLGGDYTDKNIVIKNAAQCMRIRGPLAQRIHQHTDGEQVRLVPDTPTDQPQHPGQLAYAELDVFASYNSFYVQDETYRCTDVDDDAIQALMDDFVAIEGDALSVGTARRTTVPVILDVREHEPQDTFDGWDHVTEGGLRTTTGQLIATSFNFGDSIPRTTVPPGPYAARIYYRGLGTISPDGRFGDDLYKVVLWPGAPRPAAVLKRYPHEQPGG